MKKTPQNSDIKTDVGKIQLVTKYHSREKLSEHYLKLEEKSQDETDLKSEVVGEVGSLNKVQKVLLQGITLVILNYKFLQS